MSTVTMTLQEALAKKKIYESQIEKRLSGGAYGQTYGDSVFVCYARETDTTINGINRDEFVDKMKADFVSLQHLISNLSRLKVAINASNATTKITVGGKEYTVADAIARYRALDTEKGFLNACVNQYSAITRKIADNNDKINNPDNISRYMSNMLNSESAKKNEALYTTILEDYKKNNIVYLIDPNNFKDELGGMADELNKFESEIHTALVASNVKTTITVEFED